MYSHVAFRAVRKVWATVYNAFQWQDHHLGYVFQIYQQKEQMRAFEQTKMHGNVRTPPRLLNQICLSSSNE